MQEGSVAHSPDETYDLVSQYMGVLRGTDIAQYEAAKGMLDDVLFPNTQDHKSQEIDTSRVILDLHAGIEARWSRANAASYVVRAMIQGKKVPVDLFEPIVIEAQSTISSILGDNRGRRTRKILQNVVKDVMSFPLDEEITNRSMEVYDIIGKRPRVRDYGSLVLCSLLGLGRSIFGLKEADD